MGNRKHYTEQIINTVKTIYSENIVSKEKNFLSEEIFKEQYGYLHFDYGRQRGHTTAAAQLLINFPNSLIVVHSQIQKKQVVKRVVDILSQDLYDYSFFTIDKRKIESHILVIGDSIFRHFIGNNHVYDLIIVDMYSYLNQSDKRTVNYLINHCNMLVKLQ